MTPEIREYERNKDRFDTASEAWDDIVDRSELVEDFDQYEYRDHGGDSWTFGVLVRPEEAGE